MKIDLSKEAILDNKNWKIYARLRLALLILAIIFAAYAVFRTVFPSEYFSFSFANVNSLKNTITDMKLADGNFPDKGNVSANQPIVFYTSPFSPNHSEAKISITLDKKSSSLENGKITIRLYNTEDNKNIIFEISNTTDVIQEGDLSNIFKRFFKASGSSGKKGFGLGLPIVKKIVEKNNGEITVDYNQDLNVISFEAIFPVA